MEEHQISQEKVAPEIIPEKTLFQNPPDLPPMEKDHKPIILLVIVPIIIIAIGVVLFISSLRNKDKSIKIPSPTVTLKTTSMPTQKMGISTEWLTLTSVYNYSLKYPASWQVYKTNWQEEDKLYNLQQDDEVIIRFREPNQPTHSGDPYGVTISLKKPSANPDNLSIRDWMKVNYPAFSFIKTEDITVAGIKSVKVTTLVGGKYIYVLIPFEGKVHQLVNHPFTTKDSSATSYQNLYDYENIFNQILSTVTFLGAQNKSCTSNDDCLVVINPSWCCSCPKALNRQNLNSGWVIYEKGKDYRNDLNCQKTVCEPCEPTSNIISCQNNLCQMENFQN